MKKQLVIIGIIAILITVGLSGCNSTEQTTGKTPEELIIGSWHTEIEDIAINFIFYENHSVCGTVQGMSVWSKYNITDNQIIFNNSDGTTSISEYSFTDNYQKMTIIGVLGDTMVLTKQ
jgi:hypothetical protein